MTLTWRNTRGGTKKATLPDGRTIRYWRRRRGNSFVWIALVGEIVIQTWPAGTDGNTIRATLQAWAGEEFPLCALAALGENKQQARGM